MPDHTRFQITSKQLAFIIIGSTVATGVLSLPRAVSGVAGQDAWISVILGGLIPIMSLILINRFMKKFPKRTLFEISEQLFGKILGSGMVLLIIAYAVFYQSIVLRMASEITSVFILRQTPVWMITLLIIFAVIYIAAKGGKVIGRLNELLFFLLLLDVILILTPMGSSSANVDFTGCLPVGGAGLISILKGAIPTGYAYAGIEILLFIYPMVKEKEEVVKAGLIGIGVSMTIYFLVTVTCLLVFGPDLLKIITWPTVVVIKTVSFPVIERLELLFLIFWTGIGFRPVINMCFGAAYSLSEVLRLDPQRYHPYAVIVVGVLIYGLSLIPNNIVQVFKVSTLGGYAFLAAALLYPLAFNVMTYFRKGKVKQNG